MNNNDNNHEKWKTDGTHQTNTADTESSEVFMNTTQRAETSINSRIFSISSASEPNDNSYLEFNHKPPAVFSISDTSDTEEYTSDNENDGTTVMIPTKRSELSPINSFQKIKCYGIEVEFPKNKTPFISQRSIIKSFELNEHAILESPTGTGKTLALLCSSLTWIKEKMKEETRLLKEKKETENMEEIEKQTKLLKDKNKTEIASPSLSQNQFTQPSEPPPSVVDKLENESNELRDKLEKLNKQLDNRIHHIYYCSRTHSQLSQVINELRKNDYLMYQNTDLPTTQQSELCMTVIGSKSKYCINEQVLNHPTLSVEDICGHEKQIARREDKEGTDLENTEEEAECWSHCKYDMPSRITSVANKMKGVFDIEDLKGVCRERKACPYFVAREMMERAQIIFCPYNYIIDPQIRESMGIKLKNTAIMIDEAHNILNIARDAASFKLNLYDFYSRSYKFVQYVTIVEKEQARLSKSDVSAMQSVDGLQFPMVALASLKRRTKQMENWLFDISSSLPCHNYDSLYRIEEGRSMRSLLEQSAFESAEDLDTMIINISEINAWETVAAKEDAKNNLPRKLSFLYRYLLEHIEFLRLLRDFCRAAHYLFSENGQHICDYKLIIEEKIENPKKGNNMNRYNSYNDNVNKYKNYKRKNYSVKDVLDQPEREKNTNLSLLCLNAAIVFDEIKKKTNSIILTSGTLSPLTTFATELNIKFSQLVEGCSSIDVNKQLLAMAIPTYHNVSLLGTYANRSSDQYRLAIGEAIIRLISVIPSGVLCFFQSYSMQDDMIRFWKQKQILKRISKIKKIFYEKKNAVEFDKALNSYSNFLERYEESKKRGIISTTSGGIFFGVCRGKMSEGIDFKDYMARAVINISIPYPSARAHEITLMKQYMSEQHEINSAFQTGNQWYEEQAFRALNQGLGRCIRHNRDYGAIILLDSRFASPNGCSRLSKWFRNHIRICTDESTMVLSLKQFYDRCEKEFSSTNESILPKDEVNTSSSLTESISSIEDKKEDSMALSVNTSINTNSILSSTTSLNQPISIDSSQLQQTASAGKESPYFSSCKRPVLNTLTPSFQLTCSCCKQTLPFINYVWSHITSSTIIHIINKRNRVLAKYHLTLSSRVPQVSSQASSQVLSQVSLQVSSQPLSQVLSQVSQVLPQPSPQVPQPSPQPLSSSCQCIDTWICDINGDDMTHLCLNKDNMQLEPFKKGEHAVIMKDQETNWTYKISYCKLKSVSFAGSTVYIQVLVPIAVYVIDGEYVLIQSLICSDNYKNKVILLPTESLVKNAPISTNGECSSDQFAIKRMKLG